MIGIFLREDCLRPGDLFDHPRVIDVVIRVIAIL
jgi:hypothetical protein